MVSHPETGSDSPIGSNRDRGLDTYISRDELNSMSRVVIRDLEKFPGLRPVSIILLYPRSHNICKGSFYTFKSMVLRFLLQLESSNLDHQISSY